MALPTDSIILLTAFWNILKKVLTTIAPPVDQYIFSVTSTYIYYNLRSQTCSYAQQFLNCLQSYALLPTIDKPTRLYKDSASLIDDIFLN